MLNFFFYTNKQIALVFSNSDTCENYFNYFFLKKKGYIINPQPTEAKPFYIIIYMSTQ